MDVDLSDYGYASTRPSPVNRMMAAFAADFRPGVDINLGVGYVNEQTIPRRRIEEAMRQVIADPCRHKAAFNYGGPAGSENLIQALRRFYVRRQIGGFTEELLNRQRMVIGASGATSLLHSIALTLPRGIVITSDPIYYIYCDLLQRAGFKLVTVPEDEQGIDTDILTRKLRSLGRRRRNISFVYLVTVNNPTCTILSQERRCRVVEMVCDLSREQGRRIPVIFDTAYEMLIHDPGVPRPRSALLADDAGIAYELGTLSKVLAPALRIGYLIGPSGPLLDAVVQSVSDIGFSAPLLAQEIASRLLEDGMEDQLRAVNAGYRQKAQAMRQWIDQYLGPHLAEVRGGQAGFYYYLTFKSIETHDRSLFFRRLAEGDGRGGPRVIYIPGEYCVQPGGEIAPLGWRQLRLSYGFEELGRIEAALRLMGEAAEAER